MESTFSERCGYNRVPMDHFVYEDAPEQLREYIKKVVYGNMQRSPSFLRSIICSTLLIRENRSNWSEYPNIDDEVNDHLYEIEWHQVYDIIENIVSAFKTRKEKEEYESLMNGGFCRLGIGWQLKDGIIQTRSDEAFEKTVSMAQAKLKESDFAIAHKELKEAILDLSRRPEPDLRGTVQHSVGALESVARQITGLPQKTLGDILKVHPELLPKPLDDSISKMWGYASEYARHVREDRDIKRKEAQFILGITSTIITYLIDSIKQH
jgi:hypothetical protein